MTLRRYANDTIFGVNTFFGTARSTTIIRSGIRNNSIAYSTKLLSGRERLDTIAGVEYGDGRLWWIIAAASDIGWGLQPPPGTIILIPTLESILEILG